MIKYCRHLRLRWSVEYSGFPTFIARESASISGRIRSHFSSLLSSWLHYSPLSLLVNPASSNAYLQVLSLCGVVAESETLCARHSNSCSSSAGHLFATERIRPSDEVCHLNILTRLFIACRD